MTMAPVPANILSLKPSTASSSRRSPAVSRRASRRRARTPADGEKSPVSAGASTRAETPLEPVGAPPGADIEIVRRWKHGRPQSRSLNFEEEMLPDLKCQDCGGGPVTCGYDLDGVVRWCSACAKNHDDAEVLDEPGEMVAQQKKEMLVRLERKALRDAEEIEAWKRKQRKMRGDDAAKWEARLTELRDPAGDCDSLPPSAELSRRAAARKAKREKAAAAADAIAAEGDGGADAQPGAEDEDEEEPDIEDFAGVEARTSFFEVYKTEARKRAEEGPSLCEGCRRAQAAFGAKGTTKTRWCPRCAEETSPGGTRKHPEAVDMRDDLFDALSSPRGDNIHSPRHRFLADCEKHGLPPLPLLIWEKEADRKIVRLNMFRLGNKLIGAYSHGLRLLADAGAPIEEVHMTACAIATEGPDQRGEFHDPGVVSVTDALHSLPLLLVLDLSKNVIGEQGGLALQNALEEHDRIQDVRVASCRLSDKVAGRFLRAVTAHETLTSLDMSSNSLGSTDRLYTELAGQIEYGKLKKIRFGWNSLNDIAMGWDRKMETVAVECERTPGGSLISGAIKVNQTLQHLDLSWNSIGDGGAMTLALALRFNRTLTYLDIAHNDIKEKGGMVLGDCLKENRTLETIIFSDNPLGVRGGRGMLRGLRWMCEFGIKRTMLFHRCNFVYTDSSQKLFDPVEPDGIWDCNLADPYQRTVANELVELAWTQPGENWRDEKLDGSPYELIEPEPGQVLTRDDFKLPEEGVLSVTYVPSARVARRPDVLSEKTFYELVGLINQSQTDADKIDMVQLASHEFFFTAEEAATIMTMFPSGGMSRVEVADMLLPRTVDVVNWNREIFNRCAIPKRLQFQQTRVSCPSLTAKHVRAVARSLNDGELSRLAKRMGRMFSFSPRNPTDHYRLEMSKQTDRELFTRLIEISREDREFRRVHMNSLTHLDVEIGGAINTSQKGDFDNWRNERIKDTSRFEGWQPLDIDERNPPTAGTLDLDYVSTNTLHRLTDQATIPSMLLRLLRMDLVQAIGTVRLRNSGKRKGRASVRSPGSADGSSDDDMQSIQENRGRGARTLPVLDTSQATCSFSRPLPLFRLSQSGTHQPKVATHPLLWPRLEAFC